MPRKPPTPRRKPSALARVPDATSGAAGGAASRVDTDRLHRRVQLLVGLLVAGVYGRTVHPTIQGGDSGELATEGCTFGVAHPPGYPLLTMIANAMAMLPRSEGTATVFSTNVFNAAVSAIAATLLFRCITTAAGRSSIAIWCAAAAAVSYAFSPLTWLYATGNEVFALNQFFVALLLFLVLKYGKSGHTKWVDRGAFVCGLAMCNQHTIVLFEAPAILWILWTQYRGGVLTTRKVARWAGLFFLGLLPYAYLPIAHALKPRPGAWGYPSSLRGFWRHITRADYGTFKLYGYEGRVTPGALERTFEYAKDFTTTQAGPVLALSALGGLLAVLARGDTEFAALVKAARRSGRPMPAGLQHVARALVGVWMFYLVVFHSLSNTPLDDPMFFGVHARFWMQPNVVAFMLAGIGLTTGVTAAARKAFPSPGDGAKGDGKKDGKPRQRTRGKARGQSPPSPAAVKYGTVGALLLAVVIVGLALAKNFAALDMHDNDYVERFGRATLHALPNNSLILTADDLKWGSLQYVQHCEGFRLDVTVMSAPVMSYEWFPPQRELFPDVEFPGQRLGITKSQAFVDGEVFSLKTLIDANIDKRPVFFDGTIGGYTKTDDAHELAYDFRQVGLTKQAVPKGTEPPAPQQIMEEWRRVRDYMVSPPDNARFGPESWENAVAHLYWKAQVELVTYLINTAGEQKANGDSPAGYLLLAARLLDQYEGTPGNTMDSKAWRDLGLVYYGLATEAGLPEDVTDTLVPVKLGEGAGTTAAADTVADWRVLAHRRAVYAWGTWVELPEAAQDAELATIKSCIGFSEGVIRRDEERRALAAKEAEEQAAASSSAGEGGQGSQGSAGEEEGAGSEPGAGDAEL